jgi:hypothetical protein
VKNSQFLNNTVWHNDTSGSGFGELWIQYAEDNVVRNNVFVSTAQNLLVLSEGGNVNNHSTTTFSRRRRAGAAQFVWNGVELRRLHRLSQRERAGCALAVRDPLLVDPTNDDFHLRAGSPAVNAGDPAFVARGRRDDLDGAARVSGGRVDIGADELTCGNGMPDPGEQCDDGNPTRRRRLRRQLHDHRVR